MCRDSCTCVQAARCRQKCRPRNSSCSAGWENRCRRNGQRAHPPLLGNRRSNSRMANHHHRSRLFRNGLRNTCPAFADSKPKPPSKRYMCRDSCTCVQAARCRQKCRPRNSSCSADWENRCRRNGLHARPPLLGNRRSNYRMANHHHRSRLFRNGLRNTCPAFADSKPKPPSKRYRCRAYCRYALVRANRLKSRRQNARCNVARPVLAGCERSPQIRPSSLQSSHSGCHRASHHQRSPPFRNDRRRSCPAFVDPTPKPPSKLCTCRESCTCGQAAGHSQKCRHRNSSCSSGWANRFLRNALHAQPPLLGNRGSNCRTGIGQIIAPQRQSSIQI